MRFAPGITTILFSPVDVATVIGATPVEIFDFVKIFEQFTPLLANSDKYHTPLVSSPTAPSIESLNFEFEKNLDFDQIFVFDENFDFDH